MIKIGTWNIGWGFISPLWTLEFDLENIDYIIKKIKKSQSDIICFQEIHNSENNNQTQIIADKLDFKYIEIIEIADSHLKDWEKLCISIISKLRIISSKFHKLQNPNLEFLHKWKKAFSHDKWFLEIEVEYDQSIIRVLSWHIVPFNKFWKDFLDNNFQEIRNQIEEIILEKDIPTIVCADMNFEETEVLIPKIFENWFTSVLNMNKYTTPKEKKIDKILISKHLEKLSSSIMTAKTDHYLCLANIELI